MPRKLAACEPCRASKVSCDHVHPVCGRCIDTDRADECSYRARPFKRRRTGSDTPTAHTPYRAAAVAIDSGTPLLSSEDDVARTYPNPGYLGTSSHATIFDQLTDPDKASYTSHVEHMLPNSGGGGTSGAVGEAQIASESAFVEQIDLLLDVARCVDMTHAWMASGTTLPLAASFVSPCIDSLAALFHPSARSQTDTSRRLFANSCRPLTACASTSLQQYCDQFCGSNIRWETLGVGLVAVSRAITDVDRFAPLYGTRAERRRLQKLALHLADHCLEVSLSLDCLNDLQLVLQYENFIAHSMVHGDQSYHSWRKLGDVIGSLFALGYHEQIDPRACLPPFLHNLRVAAVGRSYSADKNISIFLGRPPRMDRRYCHIEKLLEMMMNADDDASGTRFSYLMETRWTASCALLKEEVLEISRLETLDQKSQRACHITTQAEYLWRSLPLAHLQNPLRLSDSHSPVERDFFFGAHLNYLHILFLVKLALLPRTSEPETELVNISAKMLHLAADAVVMKTYLANSGTGLIWKLVAYYGLPPAGVICLALLKRSIAAFQPPISLPQVVQDLGVLVAHVETGVLIDPAEPNYALLAGATQAIKSILQKHLSTPENTTALSAAIDSADVEESATNDPWLRDQGTWDFELDFWLHLSEHAELTGNVNQPV